MPVGTGRGLGGQAPRALKAIRSQRTPFAYKRTNCAFPSHLRLSHKAIGSHGCALMKRFCQVLQVQPRTQRPAYRYNSCLDHITGSGCLGTAGVLHSTTFVLTCKGIMGFQIPFLLSFFFFLQFKRLEFFELATGSMRGNELLAVRAFLAVLC